MRFWMAAAIAASALTAAPVHAAPPASAFGRIPAVVDAAISPDGQHVAVLGGASDQRVISIATIDKPGLPALALGDVEAVSLRWADNGHVLARYGFWYNPAPRVTYRLERNAIIDLNAHLVGRVLDKDGASDLLVEQPVLGSVAGPPSRVIVVGMAESTGANVSADTKIARKGDYAFAPSLFSVDPSNGRGSLVERGNSDTIGWEVDRTGAPRVRLQVDENTHHFMVLGRAKGAVTYRPVWGGGDYETRRQYVGYSDADDAIYVFDNDKLVRKRLTDGSIEPVGPGGGGQTIVWDGLSQSAIGIEAGAEKPEVTWLDPQMGAVHALLSRALKGQLVELSNWSVDRTRFVVRANAPNTPPAWYLFDAGRKELSPLGDEYPELNGAALGTTQWITYKARDGLEIPAYLTLPPGLAAGSKAPLIVLPHGGPTARDDYGFDYLVQFLATRGYAVLQPQFRGSWGFGKAFEDAGKGEWGGKMQTDLLDGIAAVKAMGAADTSRVCIVGASFGGYAALAGAAFHSDAYRCAVSFAGISDLGKLLIEEIRLYGRESASLGELKDMLGGAPTGHLMATSPARHANGVTIPVLLVHGDKDTVVPIEQSQMMADALKEAGKPVDFVTLAGENHYLAKSATRTQFLETLGAFLAKNLPVTP